MSSVIPTKYRKILKIISINTKREFSAVCDDFIEFYYGDAEADFQQSLVLTHHKYIVEREEEEMWSI